MICAVHHIQRISCAWVSSAFPAGAVFYKVSAPDCIGEEIRA